jgi:DNA-binding Lrp family transcriptional regulator
MTDLTLTELIDTEVMNTGGQYFRNREIVEATGASRAHVSQRMKKLYEEGVLESHGREWFVIDQAKLVTMLLRNARQKELEPTKLIRVPPENMTWLIEAIILLKGSRNDWEAVAHRLEDALLEDINASIENLRAARSMIMNPHKSNKRVFAHMANSGKYAENLERMFKDAGPIFLGNKVEGSVIVDDIRARAIEKAENNA